MAKTESREYRLVQYPINDNLSINTFYIFQETRETLIFLSPLTVLICIPIIKYFQHPSPPPPLAILPTTIRQGRRISRRQPSVPSLEYTSLLRTERRRIRFRMISRLVEEMEERRVRMDPTQSSHI